MHMRCARCRKEYFFFALAVAVTVGFVSTGSGSDRVQLVFLLLPLASG